MDIQRDQLYRLPWSKTDNPGGWVEVTDRCDISCPGCYRHTLEGHRSLAEIKKDIIALKELTNCDRIAIAGGEPLIYPQIIEVVDFIAAQKVKPVLLTNGIRLTWELALELKKAGLAKFHFHVDSGMNRPDWAGKTERELNRLRQEFADLVWELGGVQCGFNVTVFRSTLPDLPEIVEWCRKNVHKVQHISLVAYRGIPVHDDIEYRTGNQPVDIRRLQHTAEDLQEIAITTNEMFAALCRQIPDYQPCAYLGGTTAPDTYKFLITIHVGSPAAIYGYLGARTLEFAQAFHHLITGRYCSFLSTPKVGRKLFFMSVFDREVRKIWRSFWGMIARNPKRLLDKVYIQSVSLQQPNEMLDGRANLCDGCPNMMVYRDKLIPSCRLDEYRMFGDLITPVLRQSSAND